MRPLIEVCVEGVEGAVAAAQGGADRVELCASLLEGGLTPSMGTIGATMFAIDIPVAVMVRPRGGDFVYSEREFHSMLDDVAAVRNAGAAAAVFGCLRPDGTIDEERTSRLAARAGGGGSTFHRAFDMTRDPFEALEALIRCGVTRVLTSGQAARAEDRLPLLKALVEQAAGRIIVMGCGALRPDNVAAVVAGAGLAEIHFSARVDVPSPMVFRRSLAMGGQPVESEYRSLGTDASVVAAVRAQFSD